jgi:hypothetical protein
VSVVAMPGATAAGAAPALAVAVDDAGASGGAEGGAGGCCPASDSAVRQRAGIGDQIGLIRIAQHRKPGSMSRSALAGP